MVYNPKNINFKEEKKSICQKLGFDDYITAITEIYNECQSLSRLSRVFNASMTALQYHLKNNNVKMRKKGGNTKKIYGSFRFLDELKNKCLTCENLEKVTLYKEVCLYRCEKNKFKKTKGGKKWEHEF